jgi:hypothetical protein
MFSDEYLNYQNVHNKKRQMNCKFIYVKINDAVSSSECIASDYRMIDELKRIWKEVVAV